MRRLFCTCGFLTAALCLSYAARAADAIPVSLPFSVTLPGPGLLSLGVYDGGNTLIRSLAAARPVEKGRLSLTWDGTSDLGLPAAPGAYHVKGAWFPRGPRADYVMKVGTSGDPPYTLADGSGGWGANLGGPEAICTNGKELTCVFGCVEDSLTTGVQRMDFQGKILGRYNTFFGWDVRLAGAMDDTHLYLAIAALNDHRFVIGKYDIGKPRGRILVDIPAGQHVMPSGRWKGRWTTDVQGLAISGSRLYVPMKLDDKLFVVDTDTGKILATWPIPSPRGVVARGGELFVLSGSKLVRLDANGQIVGTVVDGLDDPAGLALDETGNCYAAVGGPSQQVKVFSADGHPLRTIGVKGGRPRNGRYDPHGLLDPRGVCVTPDGDLWVASPAEDFQRVSVWNARTGELKREFFNTRLSADQGRLTPDEKQMLFVNDVYSDAPGVTAYDIDLEKGTWYPAWHQDLSIEQMTEPGVLRGNDHIFDQLATVFDKQAPYLSFAGGMIRANNGKTYLYGGEFSVWIFDEKTETPTLASLVYTHRAHRLGAGSYEGDYDQGPNNWFAWSDLNGDGKMSLDEVRFTQNPPAMEKVSRLFGWELQPDLSILMLCPINRGRDVPLQWAVKRLAPREIKPDGVPVYDWSDVSDLATLQVPSYVGGDGGWKGGASTYLSQISSSAGMWDIFSEPILAPGLNLHLPGIDGDGWWASRNWRNSPMRFDARGKPAWLKLGRRAPAKAAPGEMYYPRNISADIGGDCFVDDTFAQTWLWTDAGLFLGRLYHEPYEQIHDGNGVFIESTGCYAYKINGKIYACIGDHGVFVHRVTIPALTTVDGGVIYLRPETAASAIPWDPDGPPPGKRPIYHARCIYDFDAARRGGGGDFHIRRITVDGRLDDAEWGGITPGEIKMDGKVVATVKAAFDDKNLYLAYDVTDPNGLKNAGTELPFCPFTSGSYIDFCIGRESSNPDREQNVDGDVRVIMARITGGEKPIDYQMAYYPVRKDDAGHPETIVSPAAQRHFDDISPMPGLVWAYQLKPGGYTAEVSVPMHDLRTLGIRTSEPVGFDVSIGFSNETGTVRRAAAHWAGQQEAQVVDRPGSSALLPITWGTLVFDKVIRK